MRDTGESVLGIPTPRTNGLARVPISGVWQDGSQKSDRHLGA